MKKTISNENFKPKDIAEELKEAYLDYAMSVIISRALPDVRDGLKPVQRRILYAMNEDGIKSNGKFRKSATVVGSTLGRYHPHGDIAVYDALVRMAQDFSLRYPLIIGQGNFGSVDGDPPAAMRYSEVKLSPLAEEMLEDIEKETVEFIPNYDGTRNEPKYLPAKLPQLILNGAMGIAVGMATNIPPHNLTEVSEAINHLIDNPDSTTKDLMQFIKGPDFPTGGIIFGKEKLLETYTTGKGSFLCRAKAEIEEDKNKKIIVYEIPYLSNKANIISQIAKLVEEKKIEGIKDLRDESDKEGLRIVIELKNEANPNRLLNQLYKYTELEKNFYANILALTEKGLQPQVLSLKDLLSEYINHRKEIVFKRTQFLLKKTEERAHILQGLAKALEYIDEIIQLIKKSESRDDAFKKLISKYKFSDIQANAILEMKLSSLAKLEREKIAKELEEKLTLISQYRLIIKEPKRIQNIIKEEVNYLKNKYGDQRKTEIRDYLPETVSDEDLIVDQPTLVTLSSKGYIKRINPNTIRDQKRGGKGVIAYEPKTSEDILTHLLFCSTKDDLLFFTDFGRLFKLKAFEISEAPRTSSGKTIQNYLSLNNNEKVISLLNIPSLEKNKNLKYLIIATKNGLIKKTPLTEYQNIRKNGILTIKLSKGDSLIGAQFSTGNDDLILITKKGLSIRFKESEIRAMKRGTSGVIGMKLQKDDEVIALIRSDRDLKSQILTVSEKGFGKKTPLKDYRLQKRGGRGIKTYKITQKTGQLIKGSLIKEEEFLIIVSALGQTVKINLNSIPTLNRATQGVKIMKLTENDKLTSITLF
ncbi:MAG TPA: DNA gyrase subunit A [Candidatus Paceibacterota bacterium]|nr:DNA gyrase subunit A [Candidatus Paceibacterota bacterium]